MMNKYIEELVTEMLFDFNDLALGNTYKDVGYDTKKEFFEEMSRKVNELYSRLLKEVA
jgi:uncharacterized protein with von Willebrand factor type A (vWA) domain